MSTYFENQAYFDIKGKFTRGKDVNIEPFASVVCWYKITIGDNCQIAAGVRIVDFDHDFKGNVYEKGEEGEVYIGRNCVIGSNAVILKGVRLGDNCVVGAGAVVTHSFPRGSVLAGVPAKLLKKL